MKLLALIGIVLGCALGSMAQGPKVTDIVSSDKIKIYIAIPLIELNWLMVNELDAVVRKTGSSASFLLLLDIEASIDEREKLFSSFL